jgi:hypothetical protein
MRVEPIAFDWNPQFSVFASKNFLASVSDHFGWFGGFSEGMGLRCILPYTVVRKAGIKLVRFRVETIPVTNPFTIEEERLFLNCVVDHLREAGMDVIIPSTTNAVFRTVPRGAQWVPYGNFQVDLALAEDVLWRQISRIYRQNICTARTLGVEIETGDRRSDVYGLIKSTVGRSGLPFMSYGAFVRYLDGLGDFQKVFSAHYNGSLQSCVVFGFSDHHAYAIYGGNSECMVQGANKLLHWEAMRHFKEVGVSKYDFCGARLNPPKGSKQESINAFKRRLGGKLTEGYIWKQPLRRIGSFAYSMAVRFLRGGDIVDSETRRLRRPEHSV